MITQGSLMHRLIAFILSITLLGGITFLNNKMDNSFLGSLETQNASGLATGNPTPIVSNSGTLHLLVSHHVDEGDYQDVMKYHMVRNGDGSYSEPKKLFEGYCANTQVSTRVRTIGTQLIDHGIRFFGACDYSTDDPGLHAIDYNEDTNKYSDPYPVFAAKDIHHYLGIPYDPAPYNDPVKGGPLSIVIQAIRPLSNGNIAIFWMYTMEGRTTYILSIHDPLFNPVSSMDIRGVDNKNDFQLLELNNQLYLFENQYQNYTVFQDNGSSTLDSRVYSSSSDQQIIQHDGYIYRFYPHNDSMTYLDIHQLNQNGKNYYNMSFVYINFMEESSFETSKLVDILQIGDDPRQFTFGVIDNEKLLYGTDNYSNIQFVEKSLPKTDNLGYNNLEMVNTDLGVEFFFNDRPDSQEFYPLYNIFYTTYQSDWTEVKQLTYSNMFSADAYSPFSGLLLIPLLLILIPVTVFILYKILYRILGWFLPELPNVEQSNQTYPRAEEK